MKKNLLSLLRMGIFILLITPSNAQNYEIDKLRMLADIWGEVYLFHPSIVRTDKKISWEQELVAFLPSIKRKITEDEFAQIVNQKLLSVLDDRFTRVQKEKEIPNFHYTPLSSRKFDYIQLNDSILSDIENLISMDCLITDHDSQKPLLVDVRISQKLNIDPHTNTFFDYFVSLFLTDPLILSQQVSREHFGWDEWNDSPYYEQRWKIRTPNRQLADNTLLKPLKAYTEELLPHLPYHDFANYTPIKRPLYFITNNSFLSYYGNLLDNLVTHKTDVHVLNENSGFIFTSLNSGLINYPLSSSYHFILNTSFYLTNGHLVLPSYQDYDTINNTIVEKSLSENIPLQKPIPISLAISPVKYESTSSPLTEEEKILGIIKVRTILKHFYKDNQLYTEYLDQAFDKYIKLALPTETDKAYYKLILEMLAPLSDPHLLISHPSIFDFSTIFVIPINFEWIENKMVITEVRDSTIECQAGDIITAIDSIPVTQILETKRKQLPYINEQDLLSIIINPGYFSEQYDSKSTIKINDKDVTLSRTRTFWSISTPLDNKESCIYEGNIGYLNLSLLYDIATIKTELKKMRDTRGLIIDLRYSYPKYYSNEFLRMLCPYETITRIAEVPIVSAEEKETICIQKNHCSPDPDFTYKKNIAVLINNTLGFSSEDIALAMSSFPNVVFIGEQTQGINEEISKIHLPGNWEMFFTGQRIKFGNGKDFQRIGILPDIVVKKTINGVKNGQDEIMECALEYMAKQK